MISTYDRVLSAIKKAHWNLIKEYQDIGKSLYDLVEDYYNLKSLE